MRRAVSVTVVIFFVVLCGTLTLKASLPEVATGSWSVITSPMSEARTGAAAAMYDGSLLIAGGTAADGMTVLASAEIFNADGTFSAAPPMHVPRTGHAATWLLDGYVLITGGTTSGGGVVNSAELYDPLSRTWILLPETMVDARTSHTATQLPDGDVLIAGGANSAGPLNTIEVFSLAYETFSYAGAMSDARKEHAAAALSDGRVLIVGGTDANGKTLASTSIYDPNAGTLIAGPSLSTPRTAASATTLLDGKVLIAGGSYPEGAATNAPAELASAEIYDPAAETITLTSASLNTARAGHQAFLLPNNNNVLIVGGTYGGSALSSAEVYRPWTGEFAQTAAMSTARVGGVGAALSPTIDGRLLVAGGSNQTSAETYGFAWVKTDKPEYVPGETVTITGGGWQPGETVNLQLREVPPLDSNPAMTAVADEFGNISNTAFAPDNNDLGIQFFLTAVGVNSQAQTMFKDNKTLNIAKNGTGTGTVTTADGFINCGGACNHSYGNGDTVQPTATATSGSIFAGWTFTSGTPASSTCTGTTNPCSFGMNNSTITLQATFNKVTPTRLVITSVNGGANPTAGTAFSVVVQAQDSSGNVGNVTNSTGVSLSLNTGTGTLGGTLTGTISAGSNSVTINNVTYTKAEGGVVLTATRTSGDSLSSGNSSAFTVNPGAANKLAFTTSPSNGTSGSAFGTQPVVTLQDANGNTVKGTAQNVTLAIQNNAGPGGVLSGTKTVAVNTTTGQASFSGLSIDKAGTGYTLTATGSTVSTTPGVVVSSSFNITAGTAAKLAFTTSAGNSTGGVAFGTQPVVALQDANGNTVTGTAQNVTLAIQNNAGPGGVLSGTKTVAVNTTTGQASFSGLSIDKAATGYTLTATGSTVSTTPGVVVSSSFNITVGAAAQLVFTTQPGGAVATMPFSTQPIVAVRDAGGNTVTSSTAPVTLTITPGTGTSGATLACTANPLNATLGMATFAGCRIAKQGNNYQLHAASGSLATTDSSTFNVGQANTSTSVGSSTNPSTFGGSVTFTATVSPSGGAIGTPSGAVNFYDGGTCASPGTTLASAVSLSSGAASFSTSSLSATAHNLMACYSGDSDYSSSSGTVSQNVQAASTNTNGASQTAAFSASAQNVTVSATVTSGGGTVNEGTVSFTVKDGATTIGAATTSATVSGGNASVSYSLPAGTTAKTYVIQAVYNPAASNPNFTTSSDSAHSLSLNSAGSTTSASAAAKTYSPASQNVTLSATVTSAAGTVNEGSVTFTVKDGAITIGTLASAAVSGGNASVTYNLPGGTTAKSYTISAAYNPAATNPNFATSSDSTHALTVNRAASVITWANPADLYQGTPLSGTQLNATANVPGSFVYTPAAGTVLSFGAAQSLSTTFTPDDSTNYTSAVGSASINVFIDPAQVTINKTALTFPPTTVSLGSTSQMVTLFNNSSVGITVTPSVTGDYLLSGNGCTGTIAPGGTQCNVWVRFTPNSAGTLAGMLTINYSGAIVPLTVPLNGTGSPQVILGATSISYPDTNLGASSSSQTISILNRTGLPITVVPTVTGNFAITSNNCPASMPANNGCTLWINFSPTTAGAAVGNLNITAGGISQDVGLSGNGVGSITLNKTAMVFDPLTVDQGSTSQMVTLYNNSGAGITVSPSITGEFMISANGCTGVIPAHWTQCNIWVRFTPKSVGALNGQLSISANGNPVGTVALSGTGLAGPITINKTAFVFAPLTVGQGSSSQMVTLFNSSGAGITVSPSITGDFIVSANGCTGTVPAGGTQCNIWVRFTPHSAGDLGGTLTINANGNPVGTVSLTGTGL